MKNSIFMAVLSAGLTLASCSTEADGITEVSAKQNNVVAKIKDQNLYSKVGDTLPTPVTSNTQGPGDDVIIITPPKR